MSCVICQSFEHLVEECPILPKEEMFGMPCGIYRLLSTESSKFLLGTTPPQYQEPLKHHKEASNLEQAMMNLNKVMEDFVEAKNPSLIKGWESDKEVDLPTCKLEHKEESETEKEKREEIKGKKKGKSIEKDDYIDEEPQKIVIKEEIMKKQMHPLFPQALYGKIIQSKSQVRNATSYGIRKLNQIQFLMDLVFLKTS
ncbi:hypothetical protein AAG906_020276 [Vitis piasezkii]